ncbi:DUF3105 domain-containing protein [Herpetosiphon llansteffanensis]|uniref:DUF3105 domain-containing protein n=1 Tax=Herpetosiphon llansteffanensis TaxID=2094568 RepID=UPI000D7CC5AA|nr:DUF3105 domain-containing protein [Herpetosiphon llansteffanensis]
MSQPRRGRRQVSQKSQLPLVFGIGAAILVLVVVGVILLNRGNGSEIEKVTVAEGTTAPSTTGVVQELPDEGQQHVADGTKVEYKQNPPTSGSHWSGPAQWGLYQTNPPEDERIVHNMEHGGVIIWFKPSATSAAENEQLVKLFTALSAEQYRTILVSRENMDSKVALTAWNHRQLLDSVDETAIQAFFNEYILKGPECVNLRCPQ